jgi:hypothetical protein
VSQIWIDLARERGTLLDGLHCDSFFAQIYAMEKSAPEKTNRRAKVQAA